MTGPVPDFPIIDPHLHFWDPYTTPHAAGALVKMFGRHPRLVDKMVRLAKPKPLVDAIGLTEYSVNPNLPATYAEDCADYNVEAVVHIEAHWHEQKGMGVANETRWVNGLSFTQQKFGLGAIVGGGDPRRQDFAQLLDTHAAHSKKFRGIRKMAAFHDDAGVMRWCEQDGLYASSAFLNGFEHLARRNLTFDAWAYSTQLNDIYELARRFPETRIVIDHLATPAGVFGPVGKQTGRSQQEREAIFSRWQADIARAAELPNVYAKISGLMMPVLGHRFHLRREQASADRLIDLLSPFIDHALACFGTERVMFASNFPMDKVSTSLHNLMQAYLAMLRPHGESAMRRVFRDNAHGFYRMDSVM